MYILDSNIELDNITMEDNIASVNSQGVSAIGSVVKVFSSTFKNSESRFEADKENESSYYYSGVGGFFKLDSDSNLDIADSTFET